MIEPHIAEMLTQNRSAMVLNSDSVASLRTYNTLVHAMMILTNIRYSAVPVLDEKGFVRGVVSLADIIQGIIDDESYNWSLLDTKTTGEIMSTDYSRVSPNAKLEDILHELVNHNFVVVADEQSRFYGIITRKELFSRINATVHSFTELYEVLAKDDCLDVCSSVKSAQIN